jgi:AcrR family transcriptional regulator
VHQEVVAVTLTDVALPGAPFDDPALTPAGERLLDAASDLFYRRGIRAVGVDLVAEVAGTTKKTLYDRFGSKDELVALYLCRRALRWQSFLLAHLEASGPERIVAVFDALAEWLREQGRGCAFVNAYAEVGGTGHPAEAVIRAEKDWMRQVWVALAGDGSLGAELHLLYEGAIVTHTAGGREDAVATARAAAACLVRCRTPHRAVTGVGQGAAVTDDV